MLGLQGDREAAGGVRPQFAGRPRGITGRRHLRFDGPWTDCPAARMVNMPPGFAHQVAGVSKACPRPRSRPVPSQGQLLLVGRPRPFQPSDLPGARARRPGRAPDARPGRPARVRARCSVGRHHRLVVDPARGAPSMQPCASTGRGWPTVIAAGYAGIRPKTRARLRRFRHRTNGERPRQPFRHRIARADQRAGDRRACGRAGPAGRRLGSSAAPARLGRRQAARTPRSAAIDRSSRIASPTPSSSSSSRR